MTMAKNGDTLRVHYTGKLNDGTTFDTSVGGDPLEFELGAGNLIPGFEQGVIGMRPGDSKTIVVEPSDGYGEYNEDLLLTVPRAQMPEELNPTVGDELEMSGDEESYVVTVTEATDDSIVLDGNHPLAGKTLSFELELIEIVATN